MIVKLLTEQHLEFLLQRLVRVYTCQNDTLLEISCHGSFLLLGALNVRFLSKDENTVFNYKLS